MRKSRKTILAFDIFNVILSIIVFAFIYIFLKLNIYISVIITILIYTGDALLFSPDNKLMLLGIKDSARLNEYTNLLNDGYLKLDKITEIKELISKPTIKDECNNIVLKITKILKYLEKNPKKIENSKKFFTYYLDVILKILESYQNIVSQNVKSKEIDNIIDKTEKALKLVDKSLEEQFTKILKNDVLDLETEIEVLESTINMKDF